MTKYLSLMILIDGEKIKRKMCFFNSQSLIVALLKHLFFI